DDERLGGGRDFRRGANKQRRAENHHHDERGSPGHLHFRRPQHRTECAQRHGGGLLGHHRQTKFQHALPGFGGRSSRGWGRRNQGSSGLATGFALIKFHRAPI